MRLVTKMLVKALEVLILQLLQGYHCKYVFKICAYFREQYLKKLTGKCAYISTKTCSILELCAWFILENVFGLDLSLLMRIYGLMPDEAHLP